MVKMPVSVGVSENTLLEGLKDSQGVEIEFCPIFLHDKARIRD